MCKAVLRCFSQGDTLDNVKYEFLNILVGDKQDAERIAIEHYASLGLHACRLRSYADDSPNDRIRRTIEPILTKEGLRGSPDLIVIDGRGSDTVFFFVEVKTNGDSIKENQILWYKNHPSFLIKVLFVNQVISLESKIARGGFIKLKPEEFTQLEYA